MVLVVVILALVTRHTGGNGAQVNPYAAKLQISNPKLSAAENYVGGTVTYLDVAFRSENWRTRR